MRPRTIHCRPAAWTLCQMSGRRGLPWFSLLHSPPSSPSALVNVCAYFCVCTREAPPLGGAPFVTLAWVTWFYCTDGARFIPRIAGSKWFVEDSTDGAGERAHRLRITECPAGFALVRRQSMPQTDQCEECPGTFPFGYSLKTQSWTGNDSLTSDSTLALTNVCLEVCMCVRLDLLWQVCNNLHATQMTPSLSSPLNFATSASFCLHAGSVHLECRAAVAPVWSQREGSGPILSARS